jgi:hypothetical protein
MHTDDRRVDLAVVSVSILFLPNLFSLPFSPGIVNVADRHIGWARWKTFSGFSTKYQLEIIAYRNLEGGADDAIAVYGNVRRIGDHLFLHG